MKKTIFILILAAICSAFSPMPRYKVTAHKSETEVLKSVTVFYEERADAIRRMSEVPGANFVSIEPISDAEPAL